MTDIGNHKAAQDALAQILNAQRRARMVLNPSALSAITMKSANHDEAKPATSLAQTVPNALTRSDAVDAILADSSDGGDVVLAESVATDQSGSQPPIPDILAGVTFKLDPSQEAAVHGLVLSQYGCLIGAAGTGKTTTTRFLLHTAINGDAAAGIDPIRISTVDISKYNAGARKSGSDSSEEVEGDYDYDEEDDEYYDEDSEGQRIPAIVMVAFTGQATQVLKKNMPPEWRRNCMTIHSCLGFAPVGYEEDGKKKIRFEPSYTRENKMPWDIIIVDESSMVNVALWHQLLDAAKPTTRFYFIGDLNQLPPPIGMGILGFALAKWPVFELTVVHRQADDAANRIVDTAWRVLQGQLPEFDDPATNPRWRVIGFELPHESAKAHSTIISLAKGLSEKRLRPESDPNEGFIYDPWRDRILVTMNGFNESDPASALGQYPLNDSLSRLFAEKDDKRIIIDAKKVRKVFGHGYRVMATKNEPANVLDRVTNGLTGRIVDIQENPEWLGDWRLVGNEEEVAKNRQQMMLDLYNQRSAMDEANAVSAAMDEHGGTALDLESLQIDSQTEEENQSGPASHIVTVEFDNGGRREYSRNSQIEQLFIAYASTTHKAQGAEMPTVIVVVHHAQRKMLCRENLYTAITRASQRVIILYTDFGLRLALSTQKVSGSTLAQKLVNYSRLLGESGDGFSGFKMVNVRLTQEDE